MAFKMKNTSMAKLVKEAGNNRIINRMNKLQDKAEKANARGNEKRAQRKIDKMSKLEDKLMGTKRPEPTFEGTDEFRSKREIRKEARQQERADRKRKRQNDRTYDKLMSGKLRLTQYSKKEIRQAEREAKKKLRKQNKSSAVKLKDEKGPGQGTKEGQYTGAGIPENLFNANGKKINTNNLDEGNLSKIKVESGTNKKYVEYVEGPKAGGRLYLSNPK